MIQIKNHVNKKSCKVDLPNWKMWMLTKKCMEQKDVKFDSLSDMLDQISMYHKKLIFLTFLPQKCFATDFSKLVW